MGTDKTGAKHREVSFVRTQVDEHIARSQITTKDGPHLRFVLPAQKSGAKIRNWVNKECPVLSTYEPAFVQATDISHKRGQRSGPQFEKKTGWCDHALPTKLV